MKKDNTKEILSSKPRLRIASINLLNKDKISDDNNPTRESNSSRESKKSSRSEEETNSELPQFYHHPRRPRNFDPL